MKTKQKLERLPGLYGLVLSTRDVQRIYKRRAALAGLDPANISGLARASAPRRTWVRRDSAAR